MEDDDIRPVANPKSSFVFRCATCGRRVAHSTETPAYCRRSDPPFRRYYCSIDCASDIGRRKGTTQL
jgi:predicted amidophosphoribosyltransferase